MGMVLYGMDNTRDINDEIMIRHASAVKKAAKNSLVFFDLPYSKKFSEKNIIKRTINILIKQNAMASKLREIQN